jgi:S-adenosylmethionine decarboxylase
MSNSAGVGCHVLVDLYNCSLDLLNSPIKLQDIMLRGVKESGAAVLQHEFDPQGCSGIILVAESHLAWHTWPEIGFMSIDFYACGEVDPEVGVDSIVKEIGPDIAEKQVISRGRSLEWDKQKSTSSE